MKFDSIEEVEEFLDGIPKFSSTGSRAADFELTRFSDFCREIGNPQKAFASIHVAGTNGKGSTCHILGTVYQKSGYNAGIYTSPHILRFNERFRINGKVISDEQIITFFQEFGDLIKRSKLTYFEISTAIAFWWFAQSKVDIAIIEVGLGGRLDATNIIDPLLSVITSISLDHTDILGDRIEDIAAEKGGIIKKNKPVVIGDLPEAARQEIIEIAQKRSSPVFMSEELNPQYLEAGVYTLRINGERTVIRTNMVAPVQAKNLAMAWLATQKAGHVLPVAREQFLDAVSVVKLGAGRFEKLLKDQQWYFDGGHNLEAVQVLKQTVRTVGRVEDATLVLSMMKDKMRPEVMNEFSEFKNIYYYQLNLERAATFDDIKQWLPQVISIPCNRNQQSLLNDFDSELVIFAGSFYFYVKVRDWIRNYA
ncbi:MAG TPA: folylpolyglutamate synthase/dihydrofolate synthase family protein [Balneolaceae bacterium]|nr:folylpolyglutamate synthase/dihydrofolate synthase family protein [Balneolaceae bacterium]